jgi:hypothetical protein
MQAKMKKKVLDICIKFGYAELDWVDYFINEYVELVKKQIENKIDVIKEKEVIEWLEI